MERDREPEAPPGNEEDRRAESQGGSARARFWRHARQDRRAQRLSTLPLWLVRLLRRPLAVLGVATIILTIMLAISAIAVLIGIWAAGTYRAQMEPRETPHATAPRP